MTSRVLPPAGPPRVLALAQLTNSIGDGAYYVTSALYFTRIVGLSPTQLGLGLTLAWAVGFVAGVPLGHLADRRGPRGVAILLALTTAVAVASFLVVRSFLPFVVVACVYTSAQCGLAAARQALLAGLVDRTRRTATRAYLQSTLNAGLALGAGVGGLALYFDSLPAYLAIFTMDALSFLTCAVVLRGLPAPGPTTTVPGPHRLAVLRDRPYAVVSLLNMVMLLHIPLISLGIPLWIVERTAAPRWLVSTVLVVNTVAVVLFQVRVARSVTDLRSATRSVRRSGVVLLASCAVFALSSVGASPVVACAVLLGAAGLQVLGEMLQASGAWEIGFELAPADRQGQYQGLFGSGIAVARMLGPLLVTALVVTWGVPGWLLLGGVFLAAGLAMGPAVRWAQRTRPVSSPESARVPVPARRSTLGR